MTPSPSRIVKETFNPLAPTTLDNFVPPYFSWKLSVTTSFFIIPYYEENYTPLTDMIMYNKGLLLQKFRQYIKNWGSILLMRFSSTYCWNRSWKPSVV